ncbi:helix-turn-helix transcriptional regulator [Bradyrhizobium sp. Pear77]|uniref:helix-turn-helix domain-containing protein n=1 Tax=Bradyrhizobium altum TaxID=1571202 RepID=UPI001E52F72C|nr:AraC family transcriptional regulator [Bradyrhizobium altum]MCC8954190.1 helix-turn-helix transcriptional regulator [Bradyrhizobium altum]
MAEDGAYGERLRETFGVDAAPAFVARTLKKAHIAVTEIRCDGTNTGLSAPIPAEHAFLVIVQLRSVPRHDMWLNGKQIDTMYLPAGTTNIYDLRSTPVANSISSFHHVSFYLPHPALNAIVEVEEIPPIDEFEHDPGRGVIDNVLHNLAVGLLPSFRDPARANRLFVDHMAVAATAHAVKSYGNWARKGQADKCFSLSPEQIARLEEMLADKIDGDVGLADLANESGMSALQLIGSYQETTGKSVYEWLSGLRIKRAKDLLLREERGLEDIARLAGYSGVGHFVAEFTRHVGIDPERWRRPF